MGGLGVDTLIVGVGVVPFQVSGPDDVEMLAEAVRLSATRRLPW